MPSLQIEGIADMLATTLKNLGRFKFTDAAASLNRYPAFQQLMRKGHASKYNNGTAIQWSVMVGAGPAARMTGLYGVDQISQGDYMKTCSVPWKHLTHNFCYDRREMAINSGESRILDIIKARRYAAWLQVAEKLETQFWSIPTVAGDDNLYGIPYHVVKSSTALSSSNTGFTGGHASSQSDWAGQSRTTYTNLRNWAAPYTNVSKDDLISSLSDGMDRTHWMPPVEQPAYSTGRDYGIYTTLGVRKKMKQLAEGQNDNLGVDLDPYNGRVSFRRTPVEWVPKLDSDTDAPLYFLNWSGIHPAILMSEFMREQGPTVISGQHTVFAFYIDLTMNTECWNPREQGVLSTGTSGVVS